MLHMCVHMHSRYIENHQIRILEDRPLISKVVLSHRRQWRGGGSVTPCLMGCFHAVACPCESDV
jgi:hypothetical protein